jgi:hypothetical protein
MLIELNTKGSHTYALDCLRLSLRVWARSICSCLRAALGHNTRAVAFRGGPASGLAPVYDRFTEEFETPDLRDARALLASLA